MDLKTLPLKVLSSESEGGSNVCQSLDIGLGVWRWALFCFLICYHLIFALFLFLVNTSQLIGVFWKYRRSSTPLVLVQYSILSWTLRLYAKRGAFTALICETGRIRSASNQNLPFFFFCSTRFAYKRNKNCSGIKIAAQIVLVQCKEHERVGEVWKWFCHASFIGLKIAKLFRCTDRKRKFVQYKA
jgi:hypothetical protein